MNELEVLKSQLAQINNSRVKYQTLIEQAKAQCDEIMTKYNISSLEELQKLYDIAQAEYQQEVQKAQEYIIESNKILSDISGVI